MPWLESPIIYDVRAKPRNIASLTGTKDLQMVRSPTRVRWDLGYVMEMVERVTDLQVNITCRVLSRPSVNDLPAM
jgi:hypothetical protein